MQTEGALAIGTQVSAKYKGAFCEAKVRSVEKLVKVRVVFKHGLGSTTISEKDILTDKVLVVGANVQAKHPDKLEYVDAVVKEIKDQSRYTVTFNDGDIATLRRNALCMKSGKHYSASESLDNLPLTHPEHFSTPVSGSRRRGGKRASGNDTDDYDSSSDGEEVPSFYLTNIGRVVWAENTDKKCKTKESWFPALIVAPSASDTVKIDTKEEFLIRSFKDGRYYTVSKKDTNKFHKDSARKPDRENMKEAVDKAVAFLDRDELPPHWDRDILFNMGDDSTTESSESEELDEEDDSESPEEKDRLVAELYKHMEDRGQPINKNPTIDGREVDLHRLFKLVYKAGGQVRVTNKNMWQQVAKRLGFETAWCINQVRVHYNRYLKSFEQLNRTLGCTMKMTHPKSGGRTQIRGIHRSGGSGNSKEAFSPVNFVGAAASPAMTPLIMSVELDKPEVNSDEAVKEQDSKSPVALNPSKFKTEPVKEIDHQIKLEKNNEEAEVLDKPVTPVPVQSTPRKVGRPKLNKTVEKQPNTKKNTPIKTKKDASSTLKDNGIEETSSPSTPSSTPTSEKTQKKRKMDPAAPSLSDNDLMKSDKPKVEETLPTQVPQKMKEKKDAINDIIKKSAFVRVNRSDVVEKEVRKLQHQPHDEKTSNFVTSFMHSRDSSNKDFDTEEFFHDRRGRKKAKIASRDASESADLDCFQEDHQYLSDKEGISVGDKIKVFYKKDIIYEAKVVKVQQKDGEKWPKFYVHYQGWNARYDEWIKRSRIAEKLSGNKEKLKKNCIINDGEDLNEDNSEADILIVGSSNQDLEPPTPNKSAKKSGTTRGKSSPISSKVGRPGSLTPTSTNKGLNATSPPVKRQLMRSTSLKKDDGGDPDDCDETRKSSRIVKPPSTPEKRRKGRPRIHSEKRDEEATMESNDEGNADDEDKSSSVIVKEEAPKKKHGRRPEPLKNVQNQDTKESEDKKIIRKIPIGRQKREVTPVKEEDDDPYTFKEIEEGPARKSPGRPGRKPKIPLKHVENCSSSDEDGNIVREDLTPRSRSRLRKNKNLGEDGSSDNDSKKLQDVKAEPESDDDEEAIEGLQIERVDTPPPTAAPMRTSEGKKGNFELGSDNSEITLKVDEPEVEIQLEGQPVLQLSKIQKELFPNLASIRTTSPSFPRCITPTKPGTIGSKSLDSLDGDMILNDNNASNSFVGERISVRSPDLISTIPTLTSLREISPQQIKSNVSEPTSPPPRGSKLNLSVATDHSNDVVSSKITSPTDLSQSQSPKSMPIGVLLKPSGALHLAERSEVEIVGRSDEDGVFDGAKTRQSRLSSSNQLPGQNTLSQVTEPSQESSSNSKKQRKPPKKPNSSELVESDSDSGNERDKPLSSPSHKSDFREIIPEPSHVTSSAVQKHVTNNQKDPPEDGEEPLASKHLSSAKKNFLVKGKRLYKKGSHEEDNMDLVCAEIIPCSPVQLLLSVATPNRPSSSPCRKSELLYSQKEQIDSESLEMPFASRPRSSGEVEIKLGADAEKPFASGATRDDTTDEDETVSPTTATSMSSESPREFTNERSKSPAESSELDLESLNGQQKADSYEVESDRREPFGNKRKPTPSPMDNRSPLHSKRRRRTRETQSNSNRSRGSRGRNSDYFKGHDDELDDDDHPRTESDHTSLTSLGNEELLALTQKPTRKYNFFVEYDPSMDPSQRALLIQNSIKELQKTYKNLKSNLAMIERRRKKIRRKERERAERGLSGNSADGSS